MWQTTSDGVTYLLSQSGESLLRLFWFVAIFEIPRYTLGFVSVAALSFRRNPERRHVADADADRVTVLIAGHNEETRSSVAFNRCSSKAARLTRLSW